MSSQTPQLHSAYAPATLAEVGFPVISFDVLEVGQEFRSEERLIRPEDVEAYAYAVQDYEPWFFEPGPFGHPIAHPTFLANQALALRHNHYVVPAGLHARMVFEFVAPIRLGERARTTGKVVEKYIRRDKPYMVTEYRTETEDGELLVRGRFVQMLFKDPTAPASGSSRRAEPEPPPIDPAITSAEGRLGRLEVGQQLPAVQRTLSQRQIDIYSGVKPFSIHTDPEWARAKGFSNTIAQGMMSTAYVSTLMTTAVGEGFVVGGGMDTRFLRPVLCGDRLEITGTVTGFSREQDRVRVHVSVAAHNQRNEQTMAGTSSALCA
ncbi:MAG: MaoC family dehydratase [Gammaproteobacteria bacterium]|nr:MaoC family dehydratase [Gammaproteobacteria bacterium]